MDFIKNKILFWLFVLVLFSNQLLSQTITATLTDGGSTTYSCDGIDDHIQINKALEFVKDNGGTVELSSGTFFIDSAITIAGNNTTLQGAGIEQTIIKLVDDAHWTYYYKDGGEWVKHHSGPMMYNKPKATRNLTFKDFKIDGNKYKQYLYNPITGDTIRDTPTGHIFDGYGNYPAIKISMDTQSTEAVSNILFARIFLYRYSDDGFIVFDGNDIKLQDCKGIEGGHSHVYFIDPINLLIENCEFDVTANSGIRWYDGNHIVIRNNHIYGEPEKTGNSNFCIQMTSGQSSTSSDDILIESNILEHTAGAAIALDAKESALAKNVIIRNNIIFQTGNTGTYENRREAGGINIKNFTNTLIEGNTIVNCIGGGIRLGGFVGFNDWPHETGLTAVVKNNIITNNVKGAGGSAGAEGFGIDVAIGNSAVCTFNNVWGNASGNYNGCEPGRGSISVNPKFYHVSLGTEFHNTNDTNADLHLQSESGRWNNIASSWELDAETSVCINGGEPTAKYSNEPMPNGNRINLGVYGNSVEASKGTKTPPLADAGKDQFIRDDNGDGIVFVTLDGSGSVGDDITSYVWVRNNIEISSKIKDTVAFVTGVVEVTLTITDNYGITTVDKVLITVNPASSNINPKADAGIDLAVTDKDMSGKESVTLNGSASSDKDGTIVEYLWKEESITVATGKTPTVDLDVGIHKIELIVTDNEGGTDRDTVVIDIRGKGNYALSFNTDSNDEFVAINGLPVLLTFTIEMWVKQTISTNDTDGLLWFGGDGQRLTIKNNNHNVSWGESFSNTSAVGMELNKWHHIALVVESSSLIAIYIDGIPTAINDSAAIFLPKTNYSLASFYQESAYSGNFIGLIDELRFWNVARTASEINMYRDTVLIGNEHGLVGYWDFNDGSGTTLTDRKGNVDGTLYNMEDENWVKDVPFDSTTTGAVKDFKNSKLPSEFLLSQNYPNPFNPSTVISFTLPTSHNVELSVYNMLGEKVAELINKNVSAGYHSISFTASNLSSGIYFYRLQAGNFIASKKMIFIK